MMAAAALRCAIEFHIAEILSEAGPNVSDTSHSSSRRHTDPCEQYYRVCMWMKSH